MIYLDNSATTYPKPVSVTNTLNLALKKFGANPGRSGHAMSRESGMEIEKCRNVVSKFFGVSNPKNVVFTLNCTHALNLVIKGILKKGDHVVTSSIEHNAVMRPLKKLEKENFITISMAEIHPENPEKTVDEFRNKINAETALIVCNHASNVWGIKSPIDRISALAKIYDIPILVDGAQSAGIVPINLYDLDIDYFCCAGHKGLYGPMGTGILITNQGYKLNTIIEGGTGTNSMTFCHPKDMPQKFESGTPNMPGIAGLRAGIEFVNSKGINNIFNHEIDLINYLYDKLKNLNHVKLYMPKPNPLYFVPVLSFNINGYISDEIGKILDMNGIETRTGIHCAPAAHEQFGTLEIGAVRVSPSAFTTKKEIDRLVDTIKMIKPKR